MLLFGSGLDSFHCRVTGRLKFPRSDKAVFAASKGSFGLGELLVHKGDHTNP